MMLRELCRIMWDDQGSLAKVIQAINPPFNKTNNQEGSIHRGTQNNLGALIKLIITGERNLNRSAFNGVMGKFDDKEIIKIYTSRSPMI